MTGEYSAVILCHVTGEGFQKVRKALRLTQVQLAERLGVTQGAIARWETGTRPISEQTARFLRLLVEQESKTTKSRRPRRRR